MSDNRDRKLTVPKFSSFKPKTATPASIAQPLVDETSHDQKNGADEVTKERRLRHESRHRGDHGKHRSEHRHRDRKRSNSEERLDAAQTRTATKSLNNRAGDNVFFFIDKKGDPLIRRYGGNDRGRVPLYRRGGRGRVLGSDGYLYIHRDGPQEKFSIRQPGESSSTWRDRALFQPKVHRVKTKRIRVRNEIRDEAHSVEEDFVPLGGSSKRRRDEEPEASENEEPSYRSIEGKAKAHEFSDSDIDYDTDQDDALNLDTDDPLKQRSIQLSRRVKEHPEDIAGWLELIAHQDVLLNAGETLDREVTKGEVHSFAEIKISMYESALAQARKSEYEERLLVGLMLEGAKVWSASKLETRWEEVERKHESSFCLWKARVDHKLTSLATFQFNNIKSLHVARLRAIAKQESVSTSPGPGYNTNTAEISRYEQMIYVFLRATKFMYDSGYRELAVAAWQALLELNLERPASYGALPDSEILDSFKDFWEDEGPRIGDKHAPGWSQFVQADGISDPPETQKDDDNIVQSRDLYKSWGATERLRATASRNPARATDDVSEDDPYRVVMFSDIEELLFVVPADTISKIWKQLVDGFLLFCCLPPAFRTSEWIKAAEDDPLLIGGLSLFEGDVLHKPNEPDVMDETKKIPSFKQDGLRVAASADLLFATSEWFPFISGWVCTSKSADGPVDLAWVANSLRQLTTVSNLKELAEYSLAVDMVNEPSNIKKRARALIKHDPTNLGLYNAYALAESAKGNLDVGRQVILSASGLPSQPPGCGRKFLLWKTWAWAELDAGNKTQAVVPLCATVEESLRKTPDAIAVTPMQILKARQTLLDTLEGQLSMRELDDAAISTECLALLVYLTTQEASEPTSEAQGSISMAMERVWTVSSELCAQGQATSQTHERLLQAGARLLYHHASRGPFRRAYLREQLAQCIKLFPHNTIFLTLFSWATTTFGIDDPVREILREVSLTSNNDSVSSRMFAIRYELRKGNVHSTHAAFERALDSPACKSNPELWRCYIKFSYARKQFRSKAKEVFFRGLRHCPWSKDLALEAYTTLVNIMDEFELKSVFNTMASKGLRIHVDLDEFAAKHEKSRAKHR
ncbi:DUF1740 domain containing protein [Colletotrichum truncatum]|uniref:DUF1740 domain containing protein n=1 Tax=Colletotrichum truncatum TaxID=5467 RepID=A0ACC3YIP6_COLTU|nr:duf1740 domain containing protein [Colletotrichum truncatum]KAF6794359.1 duf1740 domain containing protein [Colletotrichum truncatum]